MDIIEKDYLNNQNDCACNTEALHQEPTSSTFPFIDTPRLPTLMIKVLYAIQTLRAFQGYACTFEQICTFLRHYYHLEGDVECCVRTTLLKAKTENLINECNNRFMVLAPLASIQKQRSMKCRKVHMKEMHEIFLFEPNMKDSEDQVNLDGFFNSDSGICDCQPLPPNIMSYDEILEAFKIIRTSIDYHLKNNENNNTSTNSQNLNLNTCTGDNGTRHLGDNVHSEKSEKDFKEFFRKKCKKHRKERRKRHRRHKHSKRERKEREKEKYDEFRIKKKHGILKRLS